MKKIVTQISILLASIIIILLAIGTILGIHFFKFFRRIAQLSAGKTAEPPVDVEERVSEYKLSKV